VNADQANADQAAVASSQALSAPEVAPDADDDKDVEEE
jgi:hypothetical protein